MRKYLKKIMAVVLTFAIVFSVFVVANVSAATKSELQNSISKLESQSKQIESEIKSLKGKLNAQKELKAAIERKIANVQQQINLCNSEISKINGKIAENNKQIKQKNKEIEADKLAFKKRLRTIYMSGSDNQVQILLGAENFSDFLQLSQLTASVAARDKLILENLAEAVKGLEKKRAENKKLLEEQVGIKAIVTKKQNELRNENSQIQSVINDINSTQGSLEEKNKNIEKQIKQYEKTLASMSSAGGTSFVYDGGSFLWPVPGHYGLSAGFQSNDAVHRGRHNGIDIAGGGISGKPIIAISDGVVVQSNNSCSHNYGKYGSCGCGGGYGNYVTINHGTKDGQTYVVTYGHMSHIAVGGGTVKKGQTIGYVGSTGWSTGYHLHFGIAVNGMWVNPMNFYRRVG
ncbi:MAG: peptidoglycan DD-metalloendopeptidase family protein [Clostridia bacterium]|nr:peptidoglycan DD-metalloendopeptidase family protein [Clostridia bacterium]